MRLIITDGESPVGETAEQIQKILDLLPDYLTAHYESLMLWLDFKYLSGANPRWKSLNRCEQADLYIVWLKEERDE